MPPQRPDLLDTASEENPPGGELPANEAVPVEHLCQVCPTCGSRLTGHRCKLECTVCGYYMSCADYY